MSRLVSILKGFKRRKGFFLFPIISVAVGVISVVIISSIGAVGKSIVKKEIETMGLNSLMVSLSKTSDLEFISQEELEVVGECMSVKAVAPVVFIPSQIESGQGSLDCLLWGVDGKSGEVMNFEVLHGRGINQGDVVSESRVCLVDSKYAKENYGRENIVGKNISIDFEGIKEKFEIVGVTDGEESLVKNIVSDIVPCFVYIPYTCLRQPSGEIVLNSITVTVSQAVDSKQAEKEIAARLSGFSHMSDGYKIENLTTHAQTVNNILDLITIILSLIAGVSLIISGISVMSVMMFSVRERTREIGIKKAIGASFFDIMLEFLFEAIVISLLGCSLGAVSGLTLCFLACKILNIVPVFDWSMIALCAVVTAAFGLVFGLYPAIKAARLEPAEALRRT